MRNKSAETARGPARDQSFFFYRTRIGPIHEIPLRGWPCTDTHGGQIFKHFSDFQISDIRSVKCLPYFIVTR